MLSVGLVGLPNAGKSTLFNLLTKLSVPAENYPFCTIDPHDGLVEVPDSRLYEIAKIGQSEKIIPAAIEFRDIAGLVKNANKGEGLGNTFLSHIHEVDLILLTVRCFKNNDIIHVENRVNPTEDEEILMMELTLHDEKRLENLIPRLEKEAKKDPNAKLKIQICEKILSQLSNIEPASDYVMDQSWDKDLIKWRKNLNLLTDKPIIKVANITKDGENIDYAANFELDIKLESELVDMTEEERIEFGADKKSVLDQLIKVCYKTLGLQTYLTVGPKEARAWTHSKGMLAPQCAGKIHTDFEKNFVKAVIVSYDDFIATKGWKAASEQGLVKTMGKDYVMQDGDIVEFKIAG